MGAEKFINKSELEICNGECRVVIESNVVEAEKLAIKLEKFESKKCVVKGDIEKYTIKIKNDSCFEIKDALFKDLIPFGLKYIKDSFTVNGKHEKAAVMGQSLVFKFEKICCGEEVIVSFETEVL